MKHRNSVFVVWKKKESFNMNRAQFLGNMFKAALAVAIAETGLLLTEEKPFYVASIDPAVPGMNPHVFKIKLSARWFRYNDVLRMDGEKNLFHLVTDHENKTEVLTEITDTGAGKTIAVEFIENHKVDHTVQRMYSARLETESIEELQEL